MSFSKSFAQRNIQMVKATPVPSIDDDMQAVELSTESVQLDQLFKDMERTYVCLEQLEMVADEFTTQDAFTADEANGYTDKVQGILNEGGINMPLEAAVPAFESSAMTDEELSQEAASRVGGVIQRAGAWLMEQLKKIGALIMNTIAQLGKSSQSGVIRLNRMKERLKALEGKKAEPSTEASTGGVYVKDTNLVGAGGSGTLGVLESAKSNTRKAGVETLAMLRKTMDVFKAFNPTTDATPEGAVEIVDKLIGALSLSKGEKTHTRTLPIGPGIDVLIEVNQGNYNRISCNVEMKKDKAAPGELPGMSPAECNKMLDVLMSSYKDVQSMSKPMDDAARVFRTMADAMDGRYKEFVKQSTKDKTDVVASKAASKTAVIYAMFGSILSNLGRLPRANISSYMQTQWALEGYLDACVDALEGKKRAA